MVEKIADPWNTTAEEVGALLKAGTTQDMRVEQKEVAVRMGVAPNTVSRWWAGEGVKEDQFSYLFGMLAESAPFRKRLLTALGIPVAGLLETVDDELQRKLDLVRAAHGHESDGVQTLWTSMSLLLKEQARRDMGTP